MLNSFAVQNLQLKVYVLFAFLCFCCSKVQKIQPGAERMEEYLEEIRGKRVALVVNQTSVIGNTHLVDTLVSRAINVVKILAPEHGFRGEVPDGAQIKDAKDQKTGIPIVSIYGKTRKPTPEMLEDVDVLVFDIQDVGVRCYTFISTMHYVMEAAAENNKTVIILDRPNPNGMYVDGPVKDKEINRFEAMHPIPLVHGLTVGELAQMINGEGWLANGVQCKLKLVPVAGWDHNTPYHLPIKPSPNLPNDNAIALYPSLVLFEGTVVSVGRGTSHPFEVIGHPQYTQGTYSFTPQPNAGSKYPPLEGELCHGQHFKNRKVTRALTLEYLLKYHKALKAHAPFFRSYINVLAGTKSLKKQVEAGFSEEQIKATWQPELKAYKAMRKQYLRYPDFE